MMPLSTNVCLTCGVLFRWGSRQCNCKPNTLHLKDISIRTYLLLKEEYIYKVEGKEYLPIERKEEWLFDIAL